MKQFEKPYAITENGEVKFVLYDGTKTKPVYSFCEFNNILGGYVILNELGEEVEFMDCVGNFTKKPTKFAKEFNRYINSTINQTAYSYPFCCVYFTTLIDFPSKYLTSKKISNIVKNEEVFKINQASRNGEFRNLLEKIRYKRYVMSVYRAKINKANRLLKKAGLKEKSEEMYLDL